MPDAFISYSRRDSRDFARELGSALEERGKESWVDLDDIPPASRWEDDVREGVSKSDAFVFVLSPGSVASEQCRRELDLAVERNKKVIPLLHRDPGAVELPETLRSRNWIPSDTAFEANFDQNLQRLIDALDTDLEWVRGHTRWGVQAEEWSARDRDASLLLRGSELDEAEAWFARQAGKRPSPTQLQGELILASRQASTRRQRLTFGFGAAALAIVAVLAAFALFQRSEAIGQRDKAFSRQLASDSESQRATDPALSLYLAREAVARDPSTAAFMALREALVTPNVVQTLDGPEAHMLSATPSPDGTLVATSGDDSVIRIWDAETGEQLHATTMPQGSFRPAFNRTGTELAVPGLDGHLRILDPASGEQLEEFSGVGLQLTSASYSPDGSRILVAGDAGFAGILKRDTGQVELRLEGHTDQVFVAEFSVDGSRALTAGADGTTRVWDASSGEQLAQIGPRLEGGNTVPAVSAAFSPDGSQIVTPTGHGGARLWDATTGDKLSGLGGGALNEIVSDVGFSPNGALIAIASGESVRVFDAASRRLLLSLSGHDEVVLSADFMSDGLRLVSSSEDGTARVWDASTSIPRLGFPAHNGWASVAFSPDGELLATGVEDGTVELWSTTDGKQLVTMPETAGRISDLAFSPDGAAIAIGQFDGTLLIWRLDGGAGSVDSRGSHGEQINTVAFSPDGSQVATAGSGSVQIWTSEGTSPSDEIASGAIMNAAAFSPDGKLVLATGARGAQLLDPTTGDVEKDFVDAQGRLAAAVISGGAFSPDGDRVALVDSGGDLRIWDLETNSEHVIEGLGHTGLGAAFGADGKGVVTWSVDGAARVWNLESERLVAAFQGVSPAGAPVSDAAISPDNREIAIAGQLGERVYRCPACLADNEDLETMAAGRSLDELSETERERFLP